MKVFEAYISPRVIDFFRNFNPDLLIFETNIHLKRISGINHFFESENEFIELKAVINTEYYLFNEPDRPEYGDFQTNSELSLKITNHLALNIPPPEVIVEPTCGKGNFIIASLITFSSIKEVYGIEIYRPYVWETKFAILDFFLENAEIAVPNIFIINQNVFDYNFKQIASKSTDKNILVIGNPPWVTNSALGNLNSSNLPAKSNFKKHTGLDAITGKGNFDIAEYITLMMFEAFQYLNGNVALLVKNSVIKNLVFDQSKSNYRIGNIEKHCIDSKKEFNVSVDAALFYCELNLKPEFDCATFDFYKNQYLTQRFGWIDKRFVSNIIDYQYVKMVDGLCQFEWRQGVKHDCSAVMELNKVNEMYSNVNDHGIQLEEDLIYGILKSSDIKDLVLRSSRKYTIITQRKVGEDTSYIKEKYPNTYGYLMQNLEKFQNRKSSIYKNKPLFSIFGIGDYSFKPYKIAISALYKTFQFSLVMPVNGKPLMLDDTCYMLGFDNINFAVYTLILLNSPINKGFLKAISFNDAKRTFTKDILMRINLEALSREYTIQRLREELDAFNSLNEMNIEANQWNDYLNKIKPEKRYQMKIFA
jgi:hypothetical protein